MTNPDRRALAPLRRAALALAAALALSASAARAGDVTPQNSLADMRRHVVACMVGRPLEAGSRITVRFALRRDGAILGKPRITYAHLTGDAAARRRFVTEAEAALDRCLKFTVTPSLGAAVAGRIFIITLGREKRGGGA